MEEQGEVIAMRTKSKVVTEGGTGCGRALPPHWPHVPASLGKDRTRWWDFFIDSQNLKYDGMLLSSVWYQLWSKDGSKVQLVLQKPLKSQGRRK